MIVLAFDTCFSALSVCVRGTDGAAQGRAAAMIERRQTGHAERLMPAIRGVLADAGMELRQVQRLAVTLGPGSFTGVRVAIACARALSLALSIPVVGTTSLHVAAIAAAEALPEAASAGDLVVAMDARKDAVFAQRFQDRGTRPVGPPGLIGLDQLARDAAAWNAMVVGSAAPLLAKAGATVKSSLPDLVPDASHLAEIADGLTPLAPVLPIYLRAADARLPGGGVVAGGS